MELWDISDEILTYEVIHHLDIISINNLCLCNSKLNNICNNELLWKIKTKNDYCDRYMNKSNNMSFKQYYIILHKSKQIPIYYNGDIITHVNFHSNFVSLLMNQLKQNLNEIEEKLLLIMNEQKLHPFYIRTEYKEICIVFIDAAGASRFNYHAAVTGVDDYIPIPEFNTIALIKYSNLTYNFTTYLHSENEIDNFNEINKRVTRGIIFLPALLDRNISNEDIDTYAITSRSIRDYDLGHYESAVYSELLSHFGSLPIYGILSHKNILGIIGRSKEITSFMGTGRIFCKSLDIDKLTKILSILGINEINKDKVYLCSLIRQQLSKIGHIINE